MDKTSMRKTNPAIVYDNEKNIQLSVQQCRWLLKPIGVWPKSTEISWIEKCVFVTVNVICTGLICFLFVPCAIFMAFEIENTYDTLRLCGPMSFCLMGIVKYFSLIFRENDIRRGIEYIERDWINAQYYRDRAIMIRNAKFGRRLVVTCAFFMYGGALFYYLALPLRNGTITENDGNLTYRPMIYPVAGIIVDVRQSPLNEIFFWTQSLSGFLVHSITAGTCSLIAVFAMHACGRLEVLMQWIEHLVDGREDFRGNVDERLAMIVQQHIRILDFISLTDKVLREISVVEITGCTFNMCFIGYYIIMFEICSLTCTCVSVLGYRNLFLSLQEWNISKPGNHLTFIIILISFTFNIFIFCYIGDLLVEQCRKIGEVSYMIDWHRLPGKKGLGLILVISMSNSSVKLSAANFFELSISIFGDVVKTSVAYLNILRTLT